MIAALSLRTRLLLGLLTLVAVGFLAANAIVYAMLSTYLMQRLDRQLRTGQQVLTRAYTESVDSGVDVVRSAPFPRDTYVAVVDGQGRLTRIPTAVPPSSPSHAPRLPSPLPQASPGGVALLTVLDVAGGGSYRVSIGPAGRAMRGGLSVLAMPLEDTDSILRELLQVQVAVGLAVLAGMAGLGFWVVRLGLRPLDRIAATAGAIAAGDLQQRVTPATPRTEVGRLGMALNAMLTQIEAAFASRAATEERLRRFVSDASHELRTPLSSIRGYAELFRRGAAADPQDLATAMRRIETEAARMGSLVDDLLLLARLDEGRPLERGPVDLGTLAEDAAADARAADPARAVGLRVTGDVIVRGDEARLRQVVANLVRNALVHTPPGTGLELAAWEEEQAGVLAVADHGPGIPPLLAERIFERFFRAAPGSGRDRGGSGLGLSIVGAIVSAHEGTVRVDTTPGGGATFTVRLPLFAAAEEHVTRTVPPVAQPA